MRSLASIARVVPLAIERTTARLKPVPHSEIAPNSNQPRCARLVTLRREHSLSFDEAIEGLCEIQRLPIRRCALNDKSGDFGAGFQPNTEIFHAGPESQHAVLKISNPLFVAADIGSCVL